MSTDGVTFSLQQLLMQIARTSHDLQGQLADHEKSAQLVDVLLTQTQSLAVRMRRESTAVSVDRLAEVGEAARAVGETARALHKVLEDLPRAHDARQDLQMQISAIKKLLEAAPEDLAGELEGLLDALPRPAKLRKELAKRIDALGDRIEPYTAELAAQIKRLRELSAPAQSQSSSTSSTSTTPSRLIMRSIEKLSDAARTLQPAVAGTGTGQTQRAPGKKASAAAFTIYDFALKLIGSLCVEKLENDQRFQMIMTSSLNQYNAALAAPTPELGEPMHKGAAGGKRKAPAKNRGRQGAKAAAAVAGAGGANGVNGNSVEDAPKKRGRAAPAAPRKAVKLEAVANQGQGQGVISESVDEKPRPPFSQLQSQTQQPPMDPEIHRLLFGDEN